jgi:hypothetical protein
MAMDHRRGLKRSILRRNARDEVAAGPPVDVPTMALIEGAQGDEVVAGLADATEPRERPRRQPHEHLVNQITTIAGFAEDI